MHAIHIPSRVLFAALVVVAFMLLAASPAASAAGVRHGHPTPPGCSNGC